MKRVKIIFSNTMVSSIFLIALISTVRADDAALYKEGLDYLKKGQSDFALLKFYRVVKESPKSEYAEKAQLKIVEYFYQSGQSLELTLEAKKYCELFPQGENVNNVKKMIEENEMRVLRKNGEYAFKKGDWKSCIESFKAVLEYNSDDLENKNKLTKCEEAYKRETESLLVNSGDNVEYTFLKSREEVVKETAEALGISEEQLLIKYDEFWGK